MIRSILTHFWDMSKDDAISIMNNSKVFCNFFINISKMSESNEETYYQRKKDVILKRAKGYYENDKKRLRDQARDKYRNLSEEGKTKKREYGRNRYCNISREKKQGLKKYQQNYPKAKNSQSNNQ